jgi:hypothetical protein
MPAFISVPTSFRIFKFYRIHAVSGKKQPAFAVPSVRRNIQKFLYIPRCMENSKHLQRLAFPAVDDQIGVHEERNDGTGQPDLRAMPDPDLRCGA